MKAIFILILLVAGGLTAMYYGGGFSGFDATQQGKDARAAIEIGMSWREVFDITREPRKYQVIQAKKSKVAGSEVEFLEPGPRNPFVLDTFKNRLANDELPHGFMVTYEYSNREAFTVTFDGVGKVVSVVDAPTMADLLQTRDG